MSYKYARMLDGTVMEVTMSPIVLHFEDGKVWVDVSTANPSPDVGWTLVHGQNTFKEPPDSEMKFRKIKANALSVINTAASNALKKYRPDVGMSELYREKYEQAVDFLTNNESVQYSHYPLLNVESRILEVSMKIIAENIIKRRSEWISKMTKIEELRLYGKVNIAYCSDEHEVQTLVNHLTNHLSGL